MIAPATGTCPLCGQPTDPATKPFCSRRCADIDLHRWLAGVYSVPVTEDDDEDGDAPDEPKERE